MNKDIYFKNLKDLELFFNYYCKSKHPTQEKETLSQYEGVKPTLCMECKELFIYAQERLVECKIDPKPKCRTCDVRCYSKIQWKKMAKVMKYSGFRLGLLKLKTKLFLK